ncbi:MAG: hypothetical protein AB7P02_08140 [Alphaproteobacteria bacterium]
MRAVLAALPLLAPLPAVAQESVPLRGEAFVAGRHLVDPPPEEPRDSHAYMVVRGAAAVRMFRGMRAREEEDLCRGKGWRVKRSGGLACALRAGGREGVCDFALDLRSGNLDGGRPC